MTLTVEILINRKLLAKGFQDDGMGGLVPPYGMGGFAVSEIIERCKSEAQAELAAPVDEIAIEPNMPTHWHDQNPWKDKIMYVPIPELAECVVSVGKLVRLPQGELTMCDRDFVLQHWAQHGPKLDGYIFIRGSILATAGVRFGPEGHEYLSPAFHFTKLTALMMKYWSQNRRPHENQGG